MSLAPEPPSIGLVIPCFKESRRLPPFLDTLCTLLSTMPNHGIHLLVVDDGSSHTEATKLQSYIDHKRQHASFLLPLLPLATNLGKGGAVYAGWKYFATLNPPPDYLGFVDADGAVPAAEVIRMLTSILSQPADNPKLAWFASRTPSPHTTVNRKPLRAITGSLFRILVRFLFSFPIQDTQCGFKVLPTNAWLNLHQNLRERRFLFDIELTHGLLTNQYPIREFPISWQETPGGHITGSSIAHMATGLWRLRHRLGPSHQPHD